MQTRALTAVAIAVAVLTAGCTGPDRSGPTTSEAAADPNALAIVAGSEQQKVIDTIVKPWCDKQKHGCTFTYKGSVDQARLLASGDADFDAYWFASSVFLQIGDKANVLQDVAPMFLTPIVFAGWNDEMQRLGFAGRSEVAVGDILAAVESGKTTTWVTNPTQSNSGATVFFGFLNHFAGNGPGRPLTQAQLDSAKVTDGITRFIRALDATPPSTGTLMNDCLARPDDCRTVFTYEDLVIEKNQELVAAGRQPLVATYPRGALAISDAPLGFRPRGTDGDPEKLKIFKELQNYLLTDGEAQSKLMQLGRRPVTGVGLSLSNPDTAVFNPAWGIQATLKEQPIQYPAAAVIESALARYQTRYRQPVIVYYCLDGSGSMEGNRGWQGVQDAAEQIFDQDEAAINLLQTHPQDRTVVAIFNSALVGGPWAVDGNDPGQMRGLAEQVQAYRPDGGTNMYACLHRALDEIGPPDPTGRRRLIVVMSDGKSSQNEREQALDALRNTRIPVITIAFGSDADPGQLKEVSSATGGAFFQQDDLVTALRQAAGYK